MLRNWKIQAKLFLMVGLNLFNVGVIVFFAIFSMGRIRHELIQIEQQDLVLTEYLTKLTESQYEQTIEFERALRYGVLGKRNLYNKHLRKFNALEEDHVRKYFDKSEKKIKDVLEHDKDPRVQKEFKKLGEDIQAAHKLHDKVLKDARVVFSLLGRGAVEAAEAKAETMEADEDKLNNHLKGMLAEIEAFTKAAAHRAVRHEQLAIWVLLAVAIFGVILGTILSMLITRGITKPMGLAIADIKTIAAEGDLTIRLEDTGRDEIGENARWVNQLVEKIQGIVGEISAGAGDISNSSDSLNESSQSLSTGAEEMSQQSQTIAAAANEMSQNLLVVANATEEMSTSISEVTRQAIEAARVAAEANANADRTNTVVSELGEDARRIGVVTESIADIADQTNLLALNAAIEAASAGEAGKGFAVVASEVKELARQASESAEDIKSRIQTVQSGTEQTVTAIQAITRVIAQLNEINSAIASAMEEQSITTREIASNVSQTSTAASEVSRNIEGVSQVAREGTQGADNTFTLAQALKKLAANLQQIVHQFKLNK